MLAGVQSLELRKSKKQISFITDACYRVHARPHPVAIFSRWRTAIIPHFAISGNFKGVSFC